MQRPSMSASHRPEVGSGLNALPPRRTDSRPRRPPPPRPLTSGVHAAVVKKRTPPPILASEVLREDLAPIEPGRSASRLWDGGLAVLYLAVGVAATAVVPFPYLWRAIVGAGIGAFVVALGLFGGGPLALLTGPGSTPW